MDASDPRHGTHAGSLQHYKDGEQACGPCADGARRDNKRQALDRHRGNPRMTTLGEAAWGILDRTPRKQLHQQTGIRVDKVTRYLRGGPEMRVHRTTRDRILTAGTYWTPIGIQRRVQALTALGYSGATIATETGISLDAVLRIRRRTDSPTFVREAVAEAIIATYDRLHMTPPPSGRVRTNQQRIAKANKYAPPLAWEDIDDIGERPSGTYLGERAYRPRDEVDEQTVERVLAGADLYTTVAERRVIVARWLAGGKSETSLCNRLGWRPGRYVERADLEAAG